MGKPENHDNESVWDKFSYMMDILIMWGNRICDIALVVIPVIFVVSVALQFIRFSNDGWSFFDQKTKISIDNSYYETGMKLWEELDYENAEKSLNTVLEQISQSEGRGSLKAAAVSQKLGALYLDLGRYEESYELLNSAYVTFYNNLGEKDGNTIIAKCQISVYDIRIGNIERGFAALNEAFDETKFITYKIEIMQMIAQCNMLQGNYKKALQCYKLLDTMYQKIDFSKLMITNFYNDYGVLMIKLGEYERALDYLFMAVQQWQSLGVTEDLTIANVYANMAIAYALCGQYEDAVENGEKGIFILQSLGISGSIHIAKAYENMAALYRDMKRPYTQIEYLEKALETTMDIVGKNHEVTAEIYNAIGTYYLDCDEIQSAINNYEEALEIRKNLIGKNSLVTATVYQNLSECYNRMEKYEKSIENAKEAVAICEFLCGRDNINTAQSYINLAWIYERMGNEEEASSLVGIVLDMIDRHKSIANIMMAQIYLTAGDIYLEQDCMEETSGCYGEAWRIYQSMFFDKNMYESEFDFGLENLHNGLEISEDVGRWIERWKVGEFRDEEK